MAKSRLYVETLSKKNQNFYLIAFKMYTPLGLIRFLFFVEK
jgi:hypothetical protein